MNESNEIKNNSFISGVSLIIVPLMFMLSELFHPITMDTITEEIISASMFHNKWVISHLLALVSILFLPYLVDKITDYINPKYKRIVIISNFIAHVGIIAITGLLVYDFLLLDAGKISDIYVISSFFEVINNSIFGIIFLRIGPIFFFLGLLSLLILQLITNRVKMWTSILSIIGLLIYALAGPLIPVKNGHIIVCFGAFIMLVGFFGLFVSERKRTI